ncbi:MAG: hypothetical protein JWO59_3547, partial [Chloroflexi bacterium]|nr:hypothetical protein [Chloroflexota bacterium]
MRCRLETGIGGYCGGGGISLTGIWLVSYLVLWLVVVAMGFLLVGAMRQIGLLHLERNQSFATTDPPPPPVEEDGPAIGSRISTLAAKTINNFGTVTLANRDGSVIIGTERCSGRTLLVFLSALCDNCQLAAEPLNVLAADAERGVRPIVVLRADEHACQAFISVFPLR